MQLGDNRCADGTGKNENWHEPEWNNGDACIRKCNHYAQTKDPGCCEARARDDDDNAVFDNNDATKSFCIYKPNMESTIQGHRDSKAVLCKGDYYKIGKEVSSIIHLYIWLIILKALYFRALFN